LIVFGGLAGLESALEGDDSLDVADARDLFDAYLNTCPSQGSRTIRTEVRNGLISCSLEKVPQLLPLYFKARVPAEARFAMVFFF
jgi:hypothetical protein